MNATDPMSTPVGGDALTALRDAGQSTAPALVDAVPVEALDPLRCRAHARSGKQCGKRPIMGGTVCRMHGGGAPQVKRKAAERLAKLDMKAVRTLDQLLDNTNGFIRFKAAKDILDRLGHKAPKQEEHRHAVVIRYDPRMKPPSMKDVGLRRVVLFGASYAAGRTIGRRRWAA